MNNNKKLALCIIVILATMLIISISPASAVGEGEWITAYRIEDSASGKL